MRFITCTHRTEMKPSLQVPAHFHKVKETKLDDVCNRSSGQRAVPPGQSVTAELTLLYSHSNLHLCKELRPPVTSLPWCHPTQPEEKPAGGLCRTLTYKQKAAQEHKTRPWLPPRFRTAATNPGSHTSQHSNDTSFAF